jgi:hypothetical protein
MPDDDIDISTAAPISIHPGIFTNLEGLTDDTRPFVGPAEDAFEAAVIGLTEIRELRQLAERNPALTPEARILQVSAFADRRMGDVCKQIDAADAKLKMQIDYTGGELTKPLEANVHNVAAQEIRGLVRAMKTDERRKLVTDSIASGDTQVLSALLAAHPLTTGLTTLEVETFTRLYREKAQPRMAQRLAIMKKTQQLMNDRSGLILKHAEKLVGADTKRVRAIRDADAKFSKAMAR